MNSEGRHWSDPDCVLCSWVPHLDTGEDDTTDRICSRCCEYDMASTAHRVREPRAFCLKQAKACEARARSGTEKDIAPFSRLMWERTALHWRLAAFRGFRWIPNTRTVAVLFPRMTAEVQPASAAQRRSEARPPDRRATLCSPGQLRRTAGAVRTPGRLPQPHIVPTQHPLAPPATSSRCFSGGQVCGTGQVCPSGGQVRGAAQVSGGQVGRRAEKEPSSESIHTGPGTFGEYPSSDKRNGA